ncbi:MAG: hypothetical protein J6J12_05090 [Oscillospiraceae bacterium]|nr:hypothetical protein [Oscillospiraceae bacterium]
METLEQVLRWHASKYPMMQPTDAVKLIYQNVFGGGHLIKDRETCLSALQREYKNTPQEPHAPLLESIGNGLVRVMLNAIDSSDYSIRQLADDFIRSSKEHKGNQHDFLIKLDILRKLTDSGVFHFTLEELDAYLEEYREAGYPMVSHSEQYRRSYNPAYRIVLTSIFSKENP